MTTTGPRVDGTTPAVHDVTPDELAAWETLDAAATPGPWMSATHTGRKDGIALVGRTADRGTGNVIGVFAAPDVWQRKADADFTAAAREAVPRLAAALRAAREENAALRGELNAIEAVLEPALGDRWQPAVADAWSAGVRMLAAERDRAQAIVAAARTEAAIVAETRSKLLALADEIANGYHGYDLPEIAKQIRLQLVRPIYMPGRGLAEEFEEVSDHG